LYRSLPLTMRCFSLLARAACMRLNFDKCVIVALLVHHVGVLVEWLALNAPGAHMFRIASRAKMLGLWIGPSADEVMWSAPLSKYEERVAFIKSSRQGLMRNVLHYNMFAFSCLQFVAQCATPSREVLKAEKRARQRITLAPYHALQHELLSQLRTVGLPGECHDLEHVAIAAKCRAATFSFAFADCIDEIERARDSDEALLAPRHGPWHESCILATVRSARSRVLAMPGIRIPFIAEGVMGFQRAITVQLSNHIPRRSVRSMLHQRAAKWADGDALVFANLCEPLRDACRKLPPHVTVGYLKTLCNAWNTSRRYRSDAKCCRFGCRLQAGDSLAHYLVCPATLYVVYTSLRPMLSTCVAHRPCASLLGLARELDHVAMSRHMLLMEALRSIHESLRTAEQSCTGPDELATRVRTRLRAPATMSQWARNRCIEMVGG